MKQEIPAPDPTRVLPARHPGTGIVGVWLAVIIGILMQAELLAWMYRSGVWKKVVLGYRAGLFFAREIFFSAGFFSNKKLKTFDGDFCREFFAVLCSMLNMRQVAGPGTECGGTAELVCTIGSCGTMCCLRARHPPGLI